MELIHLEKKQVDLSIIKSSLPKKYKELYFSFLETLQERNILFQEDIQQLEGAFYILEQADSTLKTIKKLEKLLKSEEDLKNILALDNIISKNRSLYARLISGYNNIVGSYFSTPLAKSKIINSFQGKPDKKGNPILGVLEK